jgi:EAL domain-containing protein (putative c-di-GMP-specific phosphodiesterase class I)
MRVHSILTTPLSPPRAFSSALIAASCILVVGQAIVIATLGYRTLGPLFSDVTQLALGLICILACTEAFRRSRGIARYAWRLLAVAFVVWAVAQVLAVYVDVSGDHSPDGIADILFFLSIIPFGMLTFLDPEGEPTSFDRLHILDFVQVGILSVSIFLCFSPRMWSPGDAFRIGHFTWSRNIAFDGLLVVTFVLRSFLTKSKAVRSLFGRMALFLLLSGLADSYALSPGQDLPPGGWFDLIWSALLGFPILIAATWKSEKGSQTDGSPKPQTIVVNQVFPLAYPLISFLVLARVTVARVGGDEFLILLTGLQDVTDAAVAAERLMDAIISEYTIQGHTLKITCSVGISIFPEHGTDADTLIKNADIAMYSAKQGGRNGFRFFTEDVNAQAIERLTLENSLQLALHRRELFLMYQPQIDMATGKIVGLEALLRWQHPELGLVPPDRFIRIAENCGLIVPIGEWVLRTACSQGRKWQEDGLSPVRVAVNVSAVQFRRQGFCEQVRTVLRETGFPPQCLELELTESLLLADAEVNLSVILELKAMGLTLAIDDFGTGYSSFSYLKQFRVSRLKIDRSFIRDVAVNSDDAAITAAIISMAKTMHLKVIAEGVEDEAQMSFLRTHRCDEIQGYYFSKPLMVDKVVDKLWSHGPEPKARAQNAQS